jgi:hypothetical protein
MRRRPVRLRLLLPAAVALLAAAQTASAAATITIVNGDSAGVGFNDPTPATPVGGNTGTTVGQQRLIAFQYAASIWDQLIDSPVEIRIKASFEALECSSDSATLGAASPAQAVSDFSGAPQAHTWYAVALANKIAGTDLIPSSDDITVTLNVNLGQTGCLDGSLWYYGLDNQSAQQINLVTVLLHEFAHGFGFITLVDESTGQEFMGSPDVFEGHILDTSTSQHWTEMTDSERMVSGVNTGKLVWDGMAVQSALPATLAGTPYLDVTAPSPIAGSLAIGSAAFGAPLTDSVISGVLAAALDPSDAAGPSTTDACSPLTNAPEVAGKIAIVDRGTCVFVMKAENAQAAGATALVIADNVAGSIPPGLGGTDSAVTIPVVSITQADGATLRANLASGVMVSLGVNPQVLAGTGAGGRLLLFAPKPDQPGSSISHWDTSALPALLMEPVLSDLPNTVDLTLPALRDIGWTTTEGGDPRQPVVLTSSPPGTPRRLEPRP